MLKRDERPASPIAVSCPGGPAPHFRVQVASGETSSSWKLVGSFRDATKAKLCADNLKRDGHNVRVIACSALPTAA